MGLNLLGGVIAFLVGAAISYGNYTITKNSLKKNQQKGIGAIGAVMVLRQVINVAYLVLVYILATNTSLSLAWLLVGAVLGLTIPMFLFTARLTRQKGAPSGEADTLTEEKGGEN